MSHILNHTRRLIYFCCRLLHRRFLRWTKPPPTSLLLGTIRDLTRGKAELVAENALLRQQLIILRRQIKRPICTKTDRLLLVLLVKAVRAWRQALLIVQPETLLKWYRQGFRLFWKQKSKAKSAKVKVKAQTIALRKRDGKQQSTSFERNGSEENCSSWIFVSANEPSRSTWGTCVRLDQEGKTGRHSCAIMPEKSGPVISSKLLIFFSVRSLRSSTPSLKSRKVIHVGVTRSPTDAWTAQQLREATPYGQAPRYLIRDNDGKLRQVFQSGTTTSRDPSTGATRGSHLCSLKSAW